MFYTFKKLRLKSIFIFYFVISCFFSNLLAKDSNPLSIDDEKEIINLFHETSVSISDFDNNDKLKNYKTRGVFILNYLKAILHKILENNKDINSLYNIKENDFNIKFLIQEHGNARATSNKTIQLILSEKDLLNTHFFDTDAEIEITFSHEIAHIILAHVEQGTNMVTKIFQEFIKKHENNEDFKNRHKNGVQRYTDLDPLYAKKYENYLKLHRDYINLKRKHEIEADNLGFKLYSNVGCDIKCYANSYINSSQISKESYEYGGEPLWFYIYILKNYFARLQEVLPYPENETEKIRSTFTRYFEKVGEKVGPYQYTYDPTGIIDTISFQPNTRAHPTFMWRFYNLLKQESNIPEDTIKKTANITTTEYVKIDLSKFKYLNDIKPFLNKRYIPNFSLDLNNIKKDPRAYIIEALFSKDSNISYQLFSSNSQNIDTIDVIQDDNTIILRANDVFRFASLSLIREINTFDRSCNSLFLKSTKILRQIPRYTMLTYFLFKIIESIL